MGSNLNQPAGSGNQVVVEEVGSVSPELAEAVGRLFPQLSSSSPPELSELVEIVSSPTTALLVARDDGVVVGMLTLVVFRIPSGLRAWIEDVVTDVSARGKGVGLALVQRALGIAWERGCVSVDLTSRPSREAANRLYRRAGFVQRETNVYRFKWEKDHR